MNPPVEVGQLLCGGFQGTGVTSQAYHLIVERRVSTMILSKHNSSSVQQLSKLIKDLQYIAHTEGQYRYPLMFALDEEGGMLNSLYDADWLNQFPGAMALAAIGDADLVYEVSKALAVELKHIGIAIIFGPVLDVVTKLSHQLVGVRSFGTTVDEVIKNGRACARGFRDGGLFPFGKHFPGIGNASVDSLLELPMLTDSLDQIRHFNALPFQQLIKEGVLDGISAAGCGVPSVSPDEVHACLSPVVVNQLLRQDLGFDGVVMSECLEMDALHHSIGLGQGVILALYAGCDLVLVCHDLTLQDEAVDSMEKALANGNLDYELVGNALRRIENLQRKLDGWDVLFPHGVQAAKEDKIVPFKDADPKLFQAHKELSQLAYRRSITLVRDYQDALPISKFLGPKASSKPKKAKANNVLLLTPLLLPVYRNTPEPPQLFSGEEVFMKFGGLLSKHPINKQLETPYKVLHTTYTANGLTSLHETLIENSKVVIVVTSEASRNMYQIGIVKYVSILCGASPASSSNAGQNYSQLTKPLILVATSSPYDFFYHKSIGSAYLCCYDYTDNVLKELVGVLMGDTMPEGCIPGEKKYLLRSKKRKLTDPKPETSLTRTRKNSPPKRRWLVDEFDLDRDWSSLVKLLKNNNEDNSDLASLSSDVSSVNDRSGSVNFQAESYYKRLYMLLSTTKSQRHFVVRNSSLNILYGIVLTWVNEETSSILSPTEDEKSGKRTGSIMYLLVDKTKRLQSIGKNIHARATRYLIQERGCDTLTLGVSFPLIVLPHNHNLVGGSGSKMAGFMNSFGWAVNIPSLKRRHIMLLSDLDKWSVPKKIFRELTIVGVRFDICNDPEKLINLINRSSKVKNSQVQVDNDSSGDEQDLQDGSDDLESIKQEKEHIKTLYKQAIQLTKNDSAYGVKIIIALEPTNQQVIGSVILFLNKSQLSKFYPFMDEFLEDLPSSAKNSPSDPNETTATKSTPLVGGIIGPVIDPAYSNLTEIFKYGLICSGITFLKSSFNDSESTQMNHCVMVGVGEDKSGNMSGIKEIGFHEWKYYYDHYDKTENLELFK